MAVKQPVKTTKTSRTKQQIQETKKKGVFTKALVVVAFALIIIYTTIALIFSAKSLVVPDSLTMSFFAAMVGELSLLSIVKSCKLKEKRGSE